MDNAIITKKQKLGHKFNQLIEQSINLLNFLTLFIVMIETKKMSLLNMFNKAHPINFKLDY
ncbi:hypothetical protein EA763_09810 [Acinetobacter lactucae]|nr:hypothetical protein EA763_09810 [Acinetobacter lactucae]